MRKTTITKKRDPPIVQYIKTENAQASSSKGFVTFIPKMDPTMDAPPTANDKRLIIILI
jgi:hypothetical protein